MLLVDYLLLFLAVALVTHGSDAKIVDFHSEEAKAASNLKELRFISKLAVPYGPDFYRDPPQAKTDRPFAGYGFGMESLDEVLYDDVNKYFYCLSAANFVSVIDFANPEDPVLTEWGLDLTEKDPVKVSICPSQKWIFFLSPDLGTLEMYSTIQRNDPADPKFIRSIPVGESPYEVLSNSNCTILAVSNKQQQAGLVRGSVTIVRDISGEPRTTSIPMNEGEGWDDEYALRKGLHMPLTRNALDYWDTHSPIANETDFSYIRSKYRSSLFILGESLAWSGPEESELLVSLQLNNGLMRIDVARDRPLALAGFGLKDHRVVPVDINQKDKKCDLKTYPFLFSMRNPDSLTTLRYNGKLYVLTGNEGDNKEYGAFEDGMRAKDFFKGGAFGLPRVKVPTSLFDYSHPLGGSHVSLFHENCEGIECVGDVTISVGSSAIDYEFDSRNPTFHRMVMFGGRGWTIFELPHDPDDLMKLVYDSGDDMERITCERFPWAYNGYMNDVLAPIDGPNNTLWLANQDDEEMVEEMLEYHDPERKGCLDRGDGQAGACPLKDTVDWRSGKDGPSYEAVSIGVACGRLVAVTVGEKNSVAFLYDITNIAEPELLTVFHLSPASKDKSPGLAYNDGTMGVVYASQFIFLSAFESPTGKASILFVGSKSGIMSLYEFECGEDADVSVEVTSQAPTTAGASILVSFTLLLCSVFLWE